MVLLYLYRGLVLKKIGVVYRLAYIQLHIRVSISSTKVEILGRKKTKWDKNSH